VNEKKEPLPISQLDQETLTSKKNPNFINKQKDYLKMHIEKINFPNSRKPELYSIFEQIFMMLEDEKKQKNNLFFDNLKTLLIAKETNFDDLLKNKERKPSLKNLPDETRKKSQKFIFKKEEDASYQEFLKWQEEQKISEKNRIQPINKGPNEPIKELKLEKNEKVTTSEKKTEPSRDNNIKGKVMMNKLIARLDLNRIEQPRAQTAEAVISPKKEPTSHIVMQSYPRPKRIRKREIHSSNLTEITPPIEPKEEENKNFSKNKFLYKYPFKKIADFKTSEDEEQLNIADGFDDYFGNLFKKLIKQHEKCGPNCDHLKRFYHRVSFVNKHIKKEEFTINRSVIDKLPLVNNYYDIVL
jgi:hypothetical protein